AFDLGMTAMSNHHDLEPELAHLRHLDVHLRHQGASRIEHAQAPLLGFLAHSLRHAMRAEDHCGTGGNFAPRFHEYSPFGAQIFDDVLVVYNLVANINRCAGQAERTLDDLDRAVHTGTKTTRLREHDTKGR